MVESGIKHHKPKSNHSISLKHISNVMVSTITSNALWPGQTKDYTISICCFSTKYVALRAKTGLLGIRILCLSGAKNLPMDCCFSELAL
jgi:hypothetical protein